LHSSPGEQPGSHQPSPTGYRPKQYPTPRELVSKFAQVNNRDQKKHDGSPASAETLQMLAMMAQSSKSEHARNLKNQTENHAGDYDICQIRRLNID
jgi:hypothetical protein